MRTFWDLVGIVAMAILALIVIALISDHPTVSRESTRRMACKSQLSLIAKACITYQEPNGDFFPAFRDGERFDPMKSLAMLYPAYVDNVKIFACPSTKDKPEITVTVVSEKDKRCAFGPVDSDKKCSYFYDERIGGKIGPGQAIACDADGQTWLDAQGKQPPYAGDWKRQPRKPNHETGQNVMYFDGHVRWTASVYSSSDPADNIFCPNATNGIQWDADYDAYLWDGVDSRTVENRNK